MHVVSRFLVDDGELTALHGRAFGNLVHLNTDWARRLNEHALTWIGAFDNDKLVGFVQVCWDGCSHAFLLDTAVDPDWQHRGIGTSIVRRAAEEARAAGCEWLHVDFEEDLSAFYLNRCGFESTKAAVLNLCRNDLDQPGS